MKKIGLFLFSGFLLLSCTSSKSAYTVQQELEAYLGKPLDASFTLLTPEEQKSKVVVFDYQIKITGSKVAGVKLLDFINSGQVNYWIHFRTTSLSGKNKIVLPAPLPSVESTIDLFFKVTTALGITYYKKEEFSKLLNLFDGVVVSDQAGGSRIEFSSIPADYEIEYIMNQTFSALPFSIAFHFIESAVYRELNFRIDTGNDFNPAYLSTNNSFLLTNENASGNLVEKFVEKNEKVAGGTLQLGGNISVKNDVENFEPSEPAIFYFPVAKEIIKDSDPVYTAIFNLNRNTFSPVRGFSDFQRTGFISGIKKNLNLPGDTDTKLKAGVLKNQMDVIKSYVEAIKLDSLDSQGKIDVYFLQHDGNYVKNLINLIWLSNLWISNPGFVLRMNGNDVTIQETSVKNLIGTTPFAGYN